MTIKIVCGGDVRDARIIDEKSGAELQEDCTRAQIILDTSESSKPQLILHFTNVKLSIRGEVHEMHPPAGLLYDDFVVRKKPGL